MSNLLDAFGVDPILEEEGVWVEILKDVKVKVCAAGNSKFNKMRERLEAPHQSKIRAGNFDPEMQESIFLKCMARTLLVDWDGIKDPDTNEILPYSYDNALRILSDPRIKRFRGTITTLCLEQETFRKQEEEDSLKNLDQSLDGSLSGKGKKKS